MKSDYEETFALQRLFEKWVVKEQWLVNEEAIPLLLGSDPTTDFLNSEYKQLQVKVNTAISDGKLEIIETEAGSAIKPAAIYQWAMTNRLELPMELVNLMEFVLKSILATSPEPSSENQFELASVENDRHQVLGACLAIVANFPDECKNAKGVIKTEAILRLLAKHSDKLFAGQLPKMSSTAIRDLVNQWLQKLK